MQEKEQPKLLLHLGIVSIPVYPLRQVFPGFIYLLINRLMYRCITLLVYTHSLAGTVANEWKNIAVMVQIGN